MTDGAFGQNVSPYLTVDGAESAIQFYEQVLGAECTYKMPAEDGKRLTHASLKLRGCIFNVGDAFPEYGGPGAPDLKSGSPVAISVRFDDPSEVDRIYHLALKEGGRNSHAPEDMFWGDRFCQFYDPFGHRWMLVARHTQSQGS